MYHLRSWDYITSSVICSCYWTEPKTAPVLACTISEVHQLPLFTFSEDKNLLNEVGKFGQNNCIEDQVWVKRRQPLALNLEESFSPPLPVWLTWDYEKYDVYFTLLESNGWYD
jgi:hypothetical protein